MQVESEYAETVFQASEMGKLAFCRIVFNPKTQHIWRDNDHIIPVFESATLVVMGGDGLLTVLKRRHTQVQ
jgi:hypothetical protein